MWENAGEIHTNLVLQKNLSLCWQDHFRKVCTPNYVNVFRDRGGVLGVVEFDSPEDLARAIRKLDDTEFRNPFERAYIRVVDDSDATKGGGARGRSRSRRVLLAMRLHLFVFVLPATVVILLLDGWLASFGLHAVPCSWSTYAWYQCCEPV